MNLGVHLIWRIQGGWITLLIFGKRYWVRGGHSTQGTNTKARVIDTVVLFIVIANSWISVQSDSRKVVVMKIAKELIADPNKRI